MHTIRKKLVTDEHMQPVAVQIEYTDWVRIEKLLASIEEPGGGPGLARFAGTVPWGEDGVAYQRRVRQEWTS